MVPGQTSIGWSWWLCLGIAVTTQCSWMGFRIVKSCGAVCGVGEM